MDVNLVFSSHAWDWICCTVVLVSVLVTELERWRMESRIEEVERVSPNTPLLEAKVVGLGEGNMGDRTLAG
jgi:hypothetical protein